MSLNKQSIHYYFFALSNFLAAFGGGMILGKGTGIINTPFLQNGSVLAFFVGTTLGLILLQLIPKKMSATLTGWLSICGGFTSLLLLNIFKTSSINGKLKDASALLFFVLLSIRFGFWFYSRVLRAANAAGQQQQIAWVELGYYLGMIFGLIIWKFFNINFGIAIALLIDATLQFVAGILDFKTSNIETKNQYDNICITKSYTEEKYENIWKWKLTSAVVLLTVGTQVVIFSLAHQTSDYLNSYILASFYLGASIAAFFCKRFKIKLAWKSKENRNLAHAMIYFEINGIEKEISIILLSLLASSCVAISIIEAYNSSLNLMNKETIFLGFIFCSAFFYEILALGILDRIGLEEKHTNHKGMVIRTYGMMSVFAAISLWIFGLTNGSLYYLLIAAMVCVLFSGFLIRERKLIRSTLTNVDSKEFPVTDKNVTRHNYVTD
jgi:hypothetical protein